MTRFNTPFNTSLKNVIQISLLLGLLVALPCFAFLDAPPPYQVRPILNGLDVKHFTKADRIKLKLYVLNNEKLDILCDAKYKGGPDQYDAKEQTIKPGKAAIFKFSYGRAVKDVVVTYVCVDPATHTHGKTILENEIPSSNEKLPENSSPKIDKQFFIDKSSSTTVIQEKIL